MTQAIHGSRRSTPRGTRWLLPAALFLPMLTIILSSVDRLSFLASVLSSGGVAKEPGDAAFIQHPFTGLLHVGPGVIMILLGPVQFIGSIRRRWPAVHRWTGRVFVLFGVVAAAAGLVMNALFPASGGLLQRVVLAFMGVALIVAVTVALRAILRRDVATHRAWMMRAFGIAVAGGTTGVVLGPYFLAFGLPGPLTVGVGRLLGLLVTMAAVEVALMRGRVPRAAPASGTDGAGVGEGVEVVCTTPRRQRGEARFARRSPPAPRT